MWFVFRGCDDEVVDARTRGEVYPEVRGSLVVELDNSITITICTLWHKAHSHILRYWVRTVYHYHCVSSMWPILVIAGGLIHWGRGMKTTGREAWDSNCVYWEYYYYSTRLPDFPPSPISVSRTTALKIRHLRSKLFHLFHSLVVQTDFLYSFSSVFLLSVSL